MTKMTDTATTGNSPGAPGSLRKNLMLAASASMIAVAAPATGLYGGRAVAQALPNECSDDGGAAIDAGNSSIDDGETIECIGVQGNYVDPIVSSADNVTIIIGDEQEPQTDGSYLNSGTVVSRIGNSAVQLDGEGDQTLVVHPDAAVVNGGFLVPAGEASVSLRTADGTISLSNQGTIATTIVSPVSGSYGPVSTAISATVEGAGDVSIDSSEGKIFGSVEVIHTGAAPRAGAGTADSKIDLKIGDLTSEHATNAGLNVEAGAAVTEFDLELGDVESAHTVGVYISDRSSATLNIAVTGAVKGTDGLYIHRYGDEDMVVTLADGSSIEGASFYGVMVDSDGNGSGVTIKGADEGTQSGVIKGASYGLELATNGGSITVQDLSSVQGGDGEGMQKCSSPTVSSVTFDMTPPAAKSLPARRAGPE